MSNSIKSNCGDAQMNSSIGGKQDPSVTYPSENLGSRAGLHGNSKITKELSPEEQQELRRKINNRERKRMQDLNVAMDALREVMVPYSAAHQHGSPGRKLSKISTLVLARNYILLLSSSLQEMKRLIGEMSGPAPRLLLAGWPLFTTQGSLLLTSDTIMAVSAHCCPQRTTSIPSYSGRMVAPSVPVPCADCLASSNLSPIPGFQNENELFS